jgi:RNA polymerase primary sigma factor
MTLHMIVLACSLVLAFMLTFQPSARGFSLVSRSVATSTYPSYLQQTYKTSSNRMDLSMSFDQPFNPFTARSRNTNVRWFEADLDKFYTFVEEQPLLTAEQEFQYGKALRMWVQIENMRTHLRYQRQNNYTELYGSTAATTMDCKICDEELSKTLGCSMTTLEKTTRFADISKARLINSNLKLVLAIVSRYRTSSIPNAELIAEGTRGLSRAALRYDYSKGFRFATYATWYVHQAIAEYVRWRKHPAKMPSRYLLLLRKVKEFSNQYKIENKRAPTVAELSEALHQTQYDVLKVLTMQSYPALLHAPLPYSGSKEGRDRTMEDILPSIFKAPLAQTDSKDLRRDMENLMQVNLNDVERDVLRLRLGLDDGTVKAVKEVGRRFKISWKQVRTVEKKALSKLLSSDEISDFVDNYHSV